MSVNEVEDGHLRPISPDKSDSPRKIMRANNSARKSWSLMAKRTDQEVLQEMGVSLLDPEESEQTGPTCSVSLKPILKRKCDIENVSPNVNLCTSPRAKQSPKSPHKLSSPSPGPSKHKITRSSEKHHSYLTTDTQSLETTIQEEYCIDEETPVGQCVSAQDAIVGMVSSGKRARTSVMSLGLEEELIINRRTRLEPEGDDSFSGLSDEMLLSVFRWLPKRTLAHCMMVCKRWQRVACDETLWQRLDLGNKTLAVDALGKILARKPIIVRLASSEISEWHTIEPPTPCRIQYLDLSMSSIETHTLHNLLARCPLLRKLSLESVPVDDYACQFIGKCSNLETLNLTMATGITANGLKALLRDDGCVHLQALNLSWCGLDEESLEVVVKTSPQRLQRLCLSGARLMTDDMVTALVSRCPRLLELDLSDCPLLGSKSISALLTLNNLEHVALSRCYKLPPHVLTKLNQMPSLQYLEVWGMLQAASLKALKAALPAININQFLFSAVARPTVGTRRTSIWGLRTRD